MSTARKTRGDASSKSRSDLDLEWKEKEMSDHGAGDRRSNGKTSEDTELESKLLTVQTKRYYVDCKENSRGRFIKITEMGLKYKSRLMFSMASASQVCEQLSAMIKFSESVPEGGEHVAENGDLKSEVLTLDSRRYYMDLKENSRGRYLRIAQTTTRPRNSRTQVAIPASGMVEVQTVLSDYLEKYCTGEEAKQANGVQNKGRQLKTENGKTIFFDVASNDRGVFVRLSEMGRSGFRQSITVPQADMVQFCKVLVDVGDEMKELAEVKEEAVEE